MFKFMRPPVSAAILVTLLVLLVPRTLAAPPVPGGILRDCSTCPELIVVPAGEFELGTDPRYAVPTEVPAELNPVRITIKHSFALGRYEVTRGEFREFVAATGYQPRERCRTWVTARQAFRDLDGIAWDQANVPERASERHPATCVDWHDAQAYVNWLTQETGEHYRLPSEAEWEYAAKAGTQTLRPWGNSADAGCRFANSFDLDAMDRYPLAWTPARCRDGYADVAPVGSLQPNAFGLYDMIGNVWEWLEDCASLTYVGRPTDQRAWVWEGGCKRRVQRGGGWITSPDRSRSSFHGDGNAEDRADFAGLRVARDLEPRHRPAPVPSGAGPPQPFDSADLPASLRDCNECPELVVIDAATVVLGSSSDAWEHDVSSGETPPFEVTVRRPYALSRFEATRADLLAFISATGFRPAESCRPQDEAAASPLPLEPARCISHATAEHYLTWLSQRTGKQYRLPSEAEWELAARGGTTGARHWSARDSHEGVSISRACDYGNVYDVSAHSAHVPMLRAGPHARCQDDYSELSPVGSFLPNQFGLYDMIGNVRERVADCFTNSYKGRPPDERAWVWSDCAYRGVRGGSYRTRPLQSRSAARDYIDDRVLTDLLDVGMRVARDLTDAELSAGRPSP